jgi:hypothetical protein
VRVLLHGLSLPSWSRLDRFHVSPLSCKIRLAFTLRQLRPHPTCRSLALHSDYRPLPACRFELDLRLHQGQFSVLHSTSHVSLTRAVLVLVVLPRPRAAPPCPCPRRVAIANADAGSRCPALRTSATYVTLRGSSNPILRVPPTPLLMPFYRHTRDQIDASNFGAKHQHTTESHIAPTHARHPLGSTRTLIRAESAFQHASNALKINGNWSRKQRQAGGSKSVYG